PTPPTTPPHPPSLHDALPISRASVVQTRSAGGGTVVKTTRTLAALAAVLGLAVLPASVVAQGMYSPVTDERLVKPEPENWLQIRDRKSTRLNSSHLGISYAVF